MITDKSDIDKSYPKWLTIELQNRIRTMFEPRAGHILSDEEVLTIAENLGGYVGRILGYVGRLNAN